MRIIAGKFKGTKLSEYENNVTRPTLDMVREAVFNKLQFSISGCNFLDLFGGTGAVALEAVSRGAGQVFVGEKNVSAISLINKNFAKVGVVPNLIKGDYEDVLKKLKVMGVCFDIVYVDPPFDAEYYEKVVDMLLKFSLLSEQAVVVLEHSAELPKINAKYDAETRKYGSVLMTYLYF